MYKSIKLILAFMSLESQIFVLNFRFYSTSSLVFIVFQSTFPTLYNDLCLSDNAMWSQYARSSQCEQDIPGAMAKRLSSFQQLLLIQATRADRLQSAMSLFACKALGKPVRIQCNLYIRARCSGVWRVDRCRCTVMDKCWTYLITVKPVFRGHLNIPKNLSLLDMCPLFAGFLTWMRYCYQKMSPGHRLSSYSSVP